MRQTQTLQGQQIVRWLLPLGLSLALVAGCGDKGGSTKEVLAKPVESATAPAAGVTYGKNGRECPKICTGEGGVSANMCKSLAIAQGCPMPESPPVAKPSIALAKPDPSINPASFAGQSIKSRRDLAELFYAL
jgi:hypothetical protein